MQQQYLSICEEVKKVAREAGNFIRQQRKTFSAERIERKQSHDYVSYVDKEAEKMIVENLRKILPDAGFITEEGTTITDVASAEPGDCLSVSEENNRYSKQTQTFTWVVDPLDGTTNFIHALPPFCVAIGLMHGYDIVLGVVYEICLDEMFSAVKGCGAYLNDEKISVSDTNSLDDSLIALGFPYDADRWRPFANQSLSDLYGHVASIRSYGSAEAELCYVACGRFDAYFESFVKPWDVTAGAIILQEAGGKISDYKGGNDDWKTGKHVAATNSLIHKEFLDNLKPEIL